MNLQSLSALPRFARFTSRRTTVNTDVAACQRPLIQSTANIQHHRLYAHQSYGGGEGNPKGENPQDQGPSQSSSLEHPGPSPPPAGRGTGGGPTKGEDHEQSVAGKKGSKEPERPATSHGAKPAIHSEGTPAEESEEVKQHNKELENRHDRASNKVAMNDKDKVEKGFWSGELIPSAMAYFLKLTSSN